MVRLVFGFLLLIASITAPQLVFAQASLDLRGNVGGSGIPGGSIIPGYDSATCDSSIEGAIRYNSASSCAEFCDGTDWVCPNSACAAPSLCPNIGDICDDGDVGNNPDPLFAGFILYSDPNSSDAGKCKALFVTNNNQGPDNNVLWKNSQGSDDIATDSTEDGKINHANRGGTLSDFQAFQLCENLSQGGFSDWYLPARDELYLLWTNRTAINANAARDFLENFHWSSSEYDINQAWDLEFGNNPRTRIELEDKDRGAVVRCVRRD